MAFQVARSTARLRERLGEYSTPQKTIVVLLALVGVVSAGAFLRWVTAPSYAVLMTGLTATDAAAVTAQLSSAGVPYELEAGGTTVLVPSEEVQAQRLAVAAAGLPQGTTKGYELLDEQSMTSSSFQQQVTYQRAVEGELSRTLEQMREVTTATVHLSVPEKELYTDESAPARASVLLDTSGTLPRSSVDSVQRLVAAAVPDLEPEAVTVSDTQGALLSSDGGTGSAAEAQRSIEDAAVARADSMLASVLGAGRAVVRVSAELDSTSRTSEAETYDPTKTATLRRTTGKEKYTGSGTPTRGQVSVPDPVDPATAGTGTGTYGKDDAQEEFGVTRKVDKSTTESGALKRLTVAVVVDDEPGGLGQQAVTDLVSNAVGVDTRRGDSITVQTTNFAEDPAAGKDAAAASRDWTRTATIGVAVAVLLLIAGTLLRAVRRGSVDEIPLSELSLTAVQEPALTAPPVPPAAARVIEAGRDDDADLRVLELVDSRPDEVGTLIRSWLVEPAEGGGR